MSRLAPVTVAVLLIAAPARAVTPDPETWHVQHPGVVLIDPAPRAGELQRLDDSERRRLCPAPEAVPQPLLQPVIRLVGPATASGADPAAQPFTLVAMSGAAAALAGDAAAGTAAV